MSTTFTTNNDKVFTCGAAAISPDPTKASSFDRLSNALLNKWRTWAK